MTETVLHRGVAALAMCAGLGRGMHGPAEHSHGDRAGRPFQYDLLSNERWVDQMLFCAVRPGESRKVPRDRHVLVRQVPG